MKKKKKKIPNFAELRKKNLSFNNTELMTEDQLMIALRDAENDVIRFKSAIDERMTEKHLKLWPAMREATQKALNSRTRL